MIHRIDHCGWLPLDDALKELKLSRYDGIHLWKRGTIEICVYLSMISYSVFTRLKNEEEYIEYKDGFHHVEMVQKDFCGKISDVPIYQYDIMFLEGIFLYTPDQARFLERDVLLGKINSESRLAIDTRLISPGHIDMVRSLKMSDEQRQEFDLMPNGKYHLESKIPFAFRQLAMRTSEITRLKNLD